MNIMRTNNYARALGLASLAISLFMMACSGRPNFRKGTYESISMQNAPADLFVPKVLWDQIEELPKAEGPGSFSKGFGGSNGDKSVKETRVDDPNVMAFVPLTVHLLEEDAGTLKNRSVKLAFGKGGGNLDLAGYVDANSHGDFIFGVDVPGLQEASQVQVYFLNNGKPRKIAGELYGESCNAVLTISSFFKKQISGLGQRVTTRQKLYIDMIVGSYIIAFQSEDHWYMTQLTITDSRFPELICRKEMDASGL